MCSKSSKDFGPGEVWIRAPPPPALRRACLPRALDATRFSRPGPILGGRDLIREPHAMAPSQIRYRSRIRRSGRSVSEFEFEFKSDTEVEFADGSATSAAQPERAR